jgi:AcrR family transcriptional regulator
MSVLSEGKRTYMRADDRRAQILDCARSVFATRGYHATNIADICEAAGIGRGTLYQYFENKRQVFFAVVEEIADQVRAVVDARPRLSRLEGAEAAPPRLIVAYCERRLRDLLDAVLADEARLRVVLREARGLDGGIDAVIRRIDGAVLDALVGDLESARALGVIECDDVRLAALFILGGVERMVLAALESEERLDLDAIVRVATRLQLDGLLSEATRRRGAPHNDTVDAGRRHDPEKEPR